MPTIEVTQPIAQFTPYGDCALIQFSWRTAASDGVPAGGWHKDAYSPTQAQLSARAPAAMLAISPGYWGDAEVRADVIAWLTTNYAFAEVTFLA